MFDLPSGNKLEDINDAINAIGESKLPLYAAFIDEVLKILIEKGYDEAIVYSQQAYLAADQNAELVRVLTIAGAIISALKMLHMYLIT